MKGQRSKKIKEYYQERNEEIEKKFIAGYSQYAIGKMFKISRERVRQIIKKLES